MAVAVDHKDPGEYLKLTKNKGFSLVFFLFCGLEVIFLGLSFVCFVDSVDDVSVRIKVKRSLIFFLETLKETLELNLRQFCFKKGIKLLNF